MLIRIQKALDTPFHVILPAEPLTPDLPGSNPKGALYLGSLSAVTPSTVCLRDINISAIVSVLSSAAWNSITKDKESAYYHIKMYDLVTEHLGYQLLEKACDFIDEKRSKGENVLVHCRAGISRSASIVIAYVIRKSNLRYEEALEFVKGKRACIAPNPGFVRCLRDWEETLHSLRSSEDVVEQSSNGQLTQDFSPLGFAEVEAIVHEAPAP